MKESKPINPCAGRLHRITAAGAVAPYRWRCIVCERQFITAPNSIRVERPGLTAPAESLKETSKSLKETSAPAPDEPLFVAVKSAVMAGRDHVATAVSKTMAKRIADALNDARKKREG